jgi:hypothetical protein
MIISTNLINRGYNKKVANEMKSDGSAGGSLRSLNVFIMTGRHCRIPNHAVTLPPNNAVKLFRLTMPKTFFKWVN